jgi:hypothetical protein
MLSWSVEETGQRLNVKPIAGGGGDPLLPGGRQLIDYVTAALGPGNVTAALQQVETSLGAAAVVDAAAVTGNFEMMNRIADGLGMPVGGGTRKRMAQVIADLRLDTYPHA